MIDGYATERQYVEHLAPIWAALPPVERGEFYVAASAVAAAALHGVGPIRIGRPGPGGPMMVAGFADHRDARRAGRPVVYVEHGSGQTYATPEGPHPSYSGSPEHDGTILFVCPSETVADRWRTAYPGVPAVAVGCPKLDRFHVDPRARARVLEAATVAISFHSDLGLCPETRSAFRHYNPALPAVVATLSAAGARVVGHGHPRIFGRIEHRWQQCGAVPVADFAEVLARADVYCVDNSCVDPNARVLCADLHWRPAGDLTPGMELIACDEEHYRMGRLRSGLEVQREDRRLRTATVTANEVRPLPRLRVTTTHGTMSVSRQHPWLVRRRVPYLYCPPDRTYALHRSYEQWAWVEADELRVGDEVAFLVPPWEVENTRPAGWLAGIFDGEGCFNRYGKTGRFTVSVAQNAGPTLDAIKAELDRRRLSYTEQKARRSCHKLTLGGGQMELLRFLGTVRPDRLVDKAIGLRAWEGRSLSGCVQRAQVLAIEDEGERPCAVLSTSTGTFVAEGFVAHNSTLYEAASCGLPTVALNAPWFRRDVHHGLRFWSSIPGAQVDGPTGLPGAVVEALADPPWLAERRAGVVAEVYAASDGKAAQRAADAILVLAG